MTAAPLIGESILAAPPACCGTTLLAWQAAPVKLLWFDVASLTFWGIVLAAVGLCLMLPRRRKLAWSVGAMLACVGLGLVAADLPPLAGYVAQGVFWLLAGVTVISAAAAVTMRSAVYAAIWFALSLLGAAGLFLFQGAQFLAAATIVVYAGAIVVTFLFVLMLAQPQGYATYDRMSWGWAPKPASALAAAVTVAVVAFAADSLSGAGKREQIAEALSRVEGSQAALLDRPDQLCRAQVESGHERTRVRLTFRNEVQDLNLPQPELKRRLAPLFVEDATSSVASNPLEITVDYLEAEEDVLDGDHMKHFGGRLFGRHLVGVEVAGALLLAALVGAIAIVIQGKQPRERREGTSHE
jgi:NADH-quinone oxidoreductase subunit J